MKSAQKIIAAMAACTMGVGILAACGGGSASSSDGKVYFLNTKPEIVDQLQELASAYTKETGIKVDIETAASGTSNQTLTSELSKTDGPSMFNIAGFDQYAKFKKYLEPVQDSEAYKLLTDEGKSYAFKDGDEAYSIPYAAEWYGIIYNKKIIRDYCAKSYAVIKSVDDITDYQIMKAVMDSIQEHKADLGLNGAVSTPGLDASDNYRFSAHMTRIPMFYELKDDGVKFTLDITGKYMGNYKDLWDTMVKDSPTESSMISSVTYEDPTAEFSSGKVAFYPNGVWAYTQIKGNDVADEDLGMLPYFMGIDGEEEYGPAAVYDANWAINKNASDKDKKASLDFIKWIVSSDTGKKTLAKEMGFAVPFTTFGDDEQPDNPLVAAAKVWSDDKGKKTVYSANIPGQQWMDNISNALVEYTQGTGRWDAVTDAFAKSWKTEWTAYKDSTGMLPPSDKLE